MTDLRPHKLLPIGHVSKSNEKRKLDRDRDMDLPRKKRKKNSSSESEDSDVSSSSSSSSKKSSTSSSTYSSTSSSSSSDRKRRKSKKRKKKLKKKEKKLKKKLKTKKKLKKQKKKETKVSTTLKIQEADSEDMVGPVPLPGAQEVPERSRLMAPMTKEQWEKKQSIVRRVYDEATGRHRLIKGDGEVIEEIVSKERHKEINRQATQGDGASFQSGLATKLGVYSMKNK